MKYKEGDTVFIRRNLKAGNSYGGCFFANRMVNYLGMKVTITQVLKTVQPRYRIKEDKGSWNWSEEMFGTYVQSRLD